MANLSVLFLNLIQKTNAQVYDDLPLREERQVPAVRDHGAAGREKRLEHVWVWDTDAIEWRRVLVDRPDAVEEGCCGPFGGASTVGPTEVGYVPIPAV